MPVYPVAVPVPVPVPVPPGVVSASVPCVPVWSSAPGCRESGVVTALPCLWSDRLWSKREKVQLESASISDQRTLLRGAPGEAPGWVREAPGWVNRMLASPGSAQVREDAMAAGMCTAITGLLVPFPGQVASCPRDIT